MNINEMFSDFNFTEDDYKLINFSHTGNTADLNKSKVISILLLIKKLDQVTDEMINSNRVKADADDRNSQKMHNLTLALVFVGIVQAVVTFVGLFH